MNLDLKSVPAIFCALILAVGVTVSPSRAEEAYQTSQDVQDEEAAAVPAEDEDAKTPAELMAERTGACEDVSYAAVRYQMTVALNLSPRHTPCVSATGSRIRHRH